MKKNILVIHHVYPIGQEIGDKIRTLHMIKSLHDIGFNVYFLAFYTKGITRLNVERKTYKAPSEKVFYIYSLPNRLRLNKLAAFFRSSVVWLICRLYKIDVIQAELAHGASCVKLVPDIPVVTDFHSDLVPELKMRGFSKYNLQYAANDNIYALKRSVRTITVSKNLYSNLLDYFETNKKNYVLPCNFNPVPFQNLGLNIREKLRARYSLEDRIVKNMFKDRCSIEKIDSRIPIRDIDIKKANYELVNKKPILASEEELSVNNRSHSAKLRIIKRLSYGKDR